MPVLGEKDSPKAPDQAVHDRNHRVSIGDGQRTARAKVILDIDDDEGGVHGDR
jgi:hypothetical protein